MVYKYYYYYISNAKIDTLTFISRYDKSSLKNSKYAHKFTGLPARSLAWGVLKEKEPGLISYTICGAVV